MHIDRMALCVPNSPVTAACRFTHVHSRMACQNMTSGGDLRFSISSSPCNEDCAPRGAAARGRTGVQRSDPARARGSSALFHNPYDM